ncbi:MAG: hypothetical protein H6766_00280 [Candidatus Peribacteria bacterium]|nr:MAG: hypothetical protein H6766_00280 [Candidatus Peribacteria bacterium]
MTGKKDGKQLKFKNTIKVSLHPAGITKEQKEFEENIEAQRDFSATITAGGSETISTWEYFYKKSISDLKAINGGVDPILDLKNPSGGFPLKIRRTINGINENIEVDGSFDVNTGEFKITTIKHEDVSGVMVPFVLESNLDIDCDMGATIKDANGKDHKPTKKLRMTILPAGMKPGQKEFEENINSDPAMEKNIYTDTPQTVETRPMFYKKDQSELPT